MVEAGKSGPMRHTPGSGKTDLDVDGALPTQAPDLAAYVRLRGLVQPVLSPIATSAISPELDCFQPLGIKGYPLGRIDERNIGR